MLNPATVTYKDLPAWARKLIGYKKRPKVNLRVSQTPKIPPNWLDYNVRDIYLYRQDSIVRLSDCGYEDGIYSKEHLFFGREAQAWPTNDSAILIVNHSYNTVDFIVPEGSLLC